MSARTKAEEAAKAIVCAGNVVRASREVVKAFDDLQDTTLSEDHERRTFELEDRVEALRRALVVLDSP